MDPYIANWPPATTRGNMIGGPPPFYALPTNMNFYMNSYPNNNNNNGIGGVINDVPPQNRKLFVGGLTHETSDDQLRQYYSQWGQVVDCIVIRDPATKNSRGFGFVTYATIQQTDNAMNNRPHVLNGKTVDSKRAIPREHMLPMASSSPYFLEDEIQLECKINLFGIHWDFHTCDGLRRYFESFGPVEQVEILGSPRGAGFIVFEDKESVRRCKAQGNEHLVDGKSLHIQTHSIEQPRRQHRLSGSQGYNSQQASRTSTPLSISSTEYPALNSLR